jgi:hypothetical protein
MSSPYIYVNASLPRQFDPPNVVRVTKLAQTGLQEAIRANDVEITAAASGSIEERILSIFLHPEVLFGDPTFIPSNKRSWLERISAFTEEGKPIEFVSMAFPYKVPNPLKTDRTAPDAGEALMLRRFQAVLDALATVYAPGGRLTILEEGILGRCQGVDPARIAAYREGIDRIVEVASVDRTRIVFHSLDDMVTRIPNFEARWIHEQERMRELWQQNDPAVRAAYTTTVAATRTSVPTWDYDPTVLAEAYDAEKTESALRYPRDYIDKVAHRQFFAYRSLLALRDSTGYLQEVRPHALKLTVSPKPENLAVVPVNTWSRILPYHGIPILDGTGKWTISYRAAAGADFGPLEALHLEGDPDAAPIAYRVAQ